jgi:hypothetical protein
MSTAFHQTSTSAANIDGGLSNYVGGGGCSGGIQSSHPGSGSTSTGTGSDPFGSVFAGLNSMPGTSLTGMIGAVA